MTVFMSLKEVVADPTWVVKNSNNIWCALIKIYIISSTCDGGHVI